jgi:hypothetical protein
MDLAPNPTISRQVVGIKETGESMTATIHTNAHTIEDSKLQEMATARILLYTLNQLMTSLNQSRSEFQARNQLIGGVAGVESV